VVLALIIITLIVGGSAYEIPGSTTLDVERGSYVVKVNNIDRAHVWLPKGSYNATVKLLELEGGSFTGVVVVLANTSIDITELSMTGVSFGGISGFNLRISIKLLKTLECHVSNTTFWRSRYLEDLKPALRESVKNLGNRSLCTLVVDTEKALGFLYVTPEHWATVSISGPGYVVALVYGVVRGGGGGGTTSPSVYSVLRESRLPGSPTPIGSIRGGALDRAELDYRLLLGLLVILFFVVVVEVVSGKSGS
jgi:hypothetical protein